MEKARFKLEMQFNDAFVQYMKEESMDVIDDLQQLKEELKEFQENNEDIELEITVNGDKIIR